jgi:hypothetical protein
VVARREERDPYRGAVNVDTRTDLGPITSIELRVPDGVAPDAVQVFANDTPIAVQWVKGDYVKISGVQPNTRYSIRFPLMFLQMPFKQIRDQEQDWAESSYAVDPGTGQDYSFHDDSPKNSYVGVFRGNTLVAVDHWPSGGIRLYQGQDRAQWASLGAVDAPVTPTHPTGRFRLKPN